MTLYKRYVALTIVDDKAAIDVGEPDFPIAITAAKRNRKGIEVLDNPNFAGDHDFHRLKITASVFDVVNIPDNPSESFYTGQVYVGIKDAVFEPSTALRYLCEQFKVLEMEGLSERAIHALRSDGGPEHRVRNGSVQVALICYFLESKCDLVIGLNTCPTQSWTSPAERVMPVLNLG